MTDFRDYDPEDSYDADDPIDVRLDVLERIVGSLDEDDDRFADRREDVLRVVRNVERENLDANRRGRLRQIRDVLEGL